MQKILAIDFGGTKIAVGLVDSSGHIFVRESLPTPKDGPEQAMKLAVELAARVQALKGPASAVGMSLPGVVDRSLGMLLRSPSSSWSNVPFVRMAQEAFGLPVSCDNDVNACAWAEACFGTHHDTHYSSGVGKGHDREAVSGSDMASAPVTAPAPSGIPGSGSSLDSFFWMTISTGIGGAIVSDHKVMAGRHGMAGELGHLIVNPGGALCGCGNRGCLEAEAAGPAWRRMALSAMDSSPKRNGDGFLASLPRDQIDAKAVAAGARAGDSQCLEIINQAGIMLARGLAAVYTILDPGAIFIGGGVGQSTDLLEPIIRRELPSLVQPALERHFRIEPSSLGYDAALLGAAALVLHPY